MCRAAKRLSRKAKAQNGLRLVAFVSYQNEAPYERLVGWCWLESLRQYPDAYGQAK